MNDVLKQHIEEEERKREHDQLNKSVIAFDAAYKYNGKWRKVYAIGVRNHDVLYQMSILHIFDPYVNMKLHKMGIYVDKIFIYGIENPSGEVKIMTTTIVFSADDLIIRGDMKRLTFIDFSPADEYRHLTYLNNLWIWGHLFHYRCDRFPVHNLRLPTGANIVHATNHTRIIDVGRLIEKNAGWDHPTIEMSQL